MRLGEYGMSMRLAGDAIGAMESDEPVVKIPIVIWPGDEPIVVNYLTFGTDAHDQEELDEIVAALNSWAGE